MNAAVKLVWKKLTKIQLLGVSWLALREGPSRNRNTDQEWGRRRPKQLTASPASDEEPPDKIRTFYRNFTAPYCDGT